MPGAWACHAFGGLLCVVLDSVLAAPAGRAPCAAPGWLLTWPPLRCGAAGSARSWGFGNPEGLKTAFGSWMDRVLHHALTSSGVC